MGNKKWFFGWENMKWFFREFLNIYSTKKSFFSKKRIESGIGFIIAEWGMIYFLIAKMSGMSMMDFVMWATVQFFVAGYIIRQIQKEKSGVVGEEVGEESPQEEYTEDGSEQK